MSSPTTCDVCGFVWDDVDLADVPARLRRSVTSFIDVLERAGEHVARRPSPDRWSVLEYAGHLRDVMISIRERVVTAAILDHPTGVAMNRDERVALGLYREDNVDDVVSELATVSGLFLKTVAVLAPSAFERTLTYSPASPYEVTIGWAVAQAVHEAEHHLGDVTENLSLLG